MDQQAKKDKTERVTGLGRKTREEIVKWNQMTALRFQTGGRCRTFLASLRRNACGRPRVRMCVGVGVCARARAHACVSVFVCVFVCVCDVFV